MRRIWIHTTGGRRGTRLCKPRHESGSSNGRSGLFSGIRKTSVNEESSVGEDAFVWLASSIPLVADVVNARFTFETLTAPTASRLYFPAYDTFLKKMDK
ncbi:hypothetical protein B296_00053617 [Ensete ventricosum]|uniref:Uncharacterized protein n=1 Tax=Ensete ventricosum TaxID=4639 RepID=A0A426Y7D5_ENSVE|nr:hypothetical protein B296_00053617 [Ensete ventricosum]